MNADMRASVIFTTVDNSDLPSVLHHASCQIVRLSVERDCKPARMQGRIQKLKSAQILRSLAARSDFTDAAVQVVRCYCL